MAEQTDVQLKAAATEIKNETVAGANTHFRVGSHLENIADSKLHKGVQVVQTTTSGRQLITHSMGRRPINVTFFDADEQKFFEYYRTGVDSGSNPLTNIILVTDKIYTNLEINFL
jgi:hypothetical protein